MKKIELWISQTTKYPFHFTMVQNQQNNANANAQDAQNAQRACEVKRCTANGDVLESFDAEDIQMAYHAIAQRIGAEIPVGGRFHTLGVNGQWDVMGFAYGTQFLLRNVRREGLDFGAVVAVGPDEQYMMYLK